MNEEFSTEDVHAGQAVYTRPMLAVYDFAVLGLACRLLWKCPSRFILEFYNRHVSANHLDVGVGTGYFLKHCRFPTPQPRVALLDLNPNSLKVAARRLAHLNPEVYQANVLEPIRIDAPRFDSIALSCLLHCLPGSMRAKAVALDYLKALLNPNGVLFGTTLLGQGVPRSFAARQAMRVFNAKRAFTNERDDLASLEDELNSRFSEVSVQLIGCLALFKGQM